MGSPSSAPPFRHIAELSREVSSLYQQGHYEPALAPATRAVTLCRQSLSKDHPFLAASLQNLGGVYRALNRYPEAEPLLIEALQIRQETPTTPPEDIASSLNELGGLYKLMGDYARAEGPYAQALEIRRAVFGEHDSRVAQSLTNLGVLYMEIGLYPKARACLERSLAIRRQTSAGQPDLARSLKTFADLHCELGDYTSAEPLYAEALGTVPDVRAAEPPLAAAIMQGQVEMYCLVGQYARAEALALQVLDIERRTVGNTHPNFAAALSDLGRIYFLMGRYDEAESLYQQALQIRTAFGASHPDLAHTLSNMAELHRTRGDYAKALSLQQQALAIRQAAYGEHHVDVAQSLNNLALVYEAMGDYGAAEPLYGQALQILRRAVGERHPNVALALNNLAAFYFAKRDHTAAESLHEQALVLTKAIYGERHHEVARSLSNLAAVYRVQGRFGEARALYGQAVEISEETLGRDHPIHSRYLNNLGELHLATGDYAAAEPLFTRALAVRRRALGERHPDVATVLYNLAALYAATGREAEAMVLMQQAVDLDTMMVGHVFSTAAESQRMAYLDLLRWRLDVFLSLVVSYASLLAGAPKTGLDLVLVRKGMGAEVLAAQRDAVLGGQYPRLEPIVRELAALRARIARKTLAGPGAGDLPSHEQQLAEWNTRKEELELSLARQIPEVQLERRLRVADAETVPLALPPETTLVEFVRFALYNFAAVPAAAQSRWGPARYIAFVVPAGQPQRVQMVDLGEADVIDERIAAWRSAITREAPPGTPGADWPVERDLRGETGTLRGALRAAMQNQSERTDRPERAPDQDEGSRLREAILDPLLPLLAGRTRLILAPDGDLARVPFEALPLPDDGYVIDGYRIQYVSTGRDVLRFGHRSGLMFSSSVVVADPDFDLSTGILPRFGSPFRRLWGTYGEGRRVASLLGVSALLLLGDAALESEVKAVASPAVLHMATHGFFFPKTPPRPAEILPEMADPRRWRQPPAWSLDAAGEPVPSLGACTGRRQ